MYWHKIRDPLLAAIFVAFVFVIQVPTQIYLGNADKLNATLASQFHLLLLAFLLCGLLCFVLFGLLTLLFGNRGAALSYALALAIWLGLHFFSGGYGVLDGSEFQIDAYSRAAIFEYSLLFALCVVAILFARRLLPVFRQGMTLLLLVSAVMLAFSWWGRDKSMMEVSPERGLGIGEFTEEFATFSSEANVLYLLFDAMQGSVVLELLRQRPEFFDGLEGFTLFEDFAAIYPDTRMALPVMLSGLQFDPSQSRAAFMTEALTENAMQQALESEGYRADYHMVPAICNRGLLSNCAGIPSVHGRYLVPLLLDLSLFRAVPTFAKAAVYNEGNWLIVPGLKHGVNEHRSAMGFIGLLNLEGLIDSVRVADVPPRFKFFQTLITHSPFVLDEDCQAVTEKKPLMSETVGAQTVCALKRLNSLLTALKELGVYDNTTIVLASDHGDKLGVPEQEGALMARGILPEHHARALAVLMVKPRNARGKMQFSGYPAAPVDIPDTILGDLGLPALGRGVNLFEASDTEPARRREFFFLEKLLNIDQEPEILAHYAINGDVRQGESWERLDPPLLERLPCNTALAFNTPELETHISPIGFSIIESWGRWTYSDNAALVFIPEQGCSAQTLQMNVKGHVVDMESRTRVTVNLNGVELGEHSFRRMDPYRDIAFSIPSGLLEPGEVNVLHFAIEGASAMAAHSRRMGLGLVSLEFAGEEIRP